MDSLEQAREALTAIREASAMCQVIMSAPPAAVARFADIHQHADAALAALSRPVEGLSEVEIENALEDAAKAAFVSAQSVYRGDHDHFPLRNTWETATESIREGWRKIAHATIEAAALPPIGTQPEPRRARSLSAIVSPMEGVKGEPVAWPDCLDPNADHNRRGGFRQYRRKQIAELRPYKKGEPIDGVSVSDADREAGSPKFGDMIARNPKNHNDRWLVAAAYFADNFEALAAPPVADSEALRERLAETLELAATNVDAAWRAKSGINCTEVCAIIRAAGLEPGTPYRAESRLAQAEGGPAVTEALKPFAEFAKNEVEWVGDCWVWKYGSMRERICDWFGPSDFGAALHPQSAAGEEGKP